MESNFKIDRLCCKMVNNFHSVFMFFAQSTNRDKYVWITRLHFPPRHQKYWGMSVHLSIKLRETYRIDQMWNCTKIPVRGLSSFSVLMKYFIQEVRVWADLTYLRLLQRYFAWVGEHVSTRHGYSESAGHKCAVLAWRHFQFLLPPSSRLYKQAVQEMLQIFAQGAFLEKFGRKIRCSLM